MTVLTFQRKCCVVRFEKFNKRLTRRVLWVFHFDMMDTTAVVWEDLVETRGVLLKKNRWERFIVRIHPTVFSEWEKTNDEQGLPLTGPSTQPTRVQQDENKERDLTHRHTDIPPVELRGPNVCYLFLRLVKWASPSLPVEGQHFVWNFENQNRYTQQRQGKERERKLSWSRESQVYNRHQLENRPTLSEYYTTHTGTCKDG